MTETWLPVVGYEGLYEVSDLGRIRSIPRSIVQRDGRERRQPGRVMRENVKASGHRSVMLSRGGVQIRFHIHRLVLFAFVGEPEVGMECCHNDGDPANNALTNLRWDTPSANSYDTVRHGRHHLANLTYCKNGHEFTPENTYLRDGHFRQCRACSNANRRKWYTPSPRGYGETRTHCLRGHEFSPENTYLNRRNARVCRACTREHSRQYKMKVKASR